ncbi:PAS domain-containing sensor histidine kinase [Halorhabdus sp. CBA1104]|uniref:PAS domain S-box protein n=1 Tax=Halorhabdus sp. CBA1104 TaxID=1380432 RepID=UPI0012B31852|nr:PAS domain S-box protein [Halorhabdus sp. CBA1104]QGN07657.1 PAS domain-containing sensor histidine kinase [Halorhabdus sp. CBA1104]
MADPGDTATNGDQAGPDWYRQLVELSPDAATIVDADGTIVYVSPAVEAILGYSPDDLTGELVSEYIHPADRASVSETIEERRVSADEPQTVEVRTRRADGSWRWVESRVVCVPDGVGGEFLVTSRPIDQREVRDTDFATTKERMRMALEGANLGIWDWDMVTDEVERDELLTEMLGYTPAEMGAHLRDWEALVHPDGKQRHNEALTAHVAERTPYYECEYRLQTKAGDWKWVRTMGTVVERADDGTPLRAVGIHQDIDDQKRAELALKEERDMFTDGPAVVFKWADAAGWPIEYVSENVEAVFGYAPEKLQTGNVRFSDLLHDGDRERVAKEVAEQRSNGSNRLSPDPYRIRTADGAVRWVMEHTKIVDEPAAQGYLLGYLVDVTERKEHERELEARERKYRNLFEDTRDALMVLDRDGYIDCNERTLELFGLDSVGAFVDRAPWELAPQTQPDGTPSKDDAFEHIERAFETGEAFFEWTHQRADGTTFPAEVKLSRFEYENEPALHALVRDITERKEYEQRLQTQRDNLDVLNRVLRHDIRNDLQLVTAYAELVAEESDDESTGEYIETVLESAEHAIELTQTAREMADVMLSADDDIEHVDLEGVLERELDEVRSAYPDAVFTVDTEIPAETVRASSMLASVFRNLLKNAVQHNDKDVPEVTVSATAQEASVVVRIADNGPGVPPAQQDAIFGKGETGLESSGTGIGLYLVETLVESYGGAVDIEDTDPAGAVFVVELPRVT